ncbi:hypothetical protein CBM2615_A20005 [Cupriavidus taiwanensis]|uniref:Uncharacterized protein n=1 Tax=Cupriavidus taiwanensis TaxID=164546 RepID=A0A375DYE5_9BURK|nr:hypothetical protein CBM2615_A20005 [Cupriavidus taiwanensis]SOZ53157.1 hypothetical protein CBM2614_A20005 [Cupriavidus taiwanensis]SOZ54961.1 hypothetical protein CBM2613_A20005 [Cupriavidus taiwanensis]SPA05336.1 hypothetical protein CBM2625_A20005 [Cupriavidus taiwanensis]
MICQSARRFTSAAQPGHVLDRRLPDRQEQIERGMIAMCRFRHSPTRPHAVSTGLECVQLVGFADLD